MEDKSIALAAVIALGSAFGSFCNLRAGFNGACYDSTDRRLFLYL